jgi:hypothetical protein
MVECSRFEASFLSPRITAVLVSDPTTTEYVMDIKDENVSDCAIALSGLLSLSRNGSFEVTSSNFGAVALVVKILGNQELCESLIGMKGDVGELNCSNVCERLLMAQSLDASPANEIEYLASHFWEMDQNVLKSLSDSLLLAVFQSEKLRICSEDSLLDFILGLADDHLHLLGFIRTEYLSLWGIDRLLNSVCVDNLDESLWVSLCCRLRLSVWASPLPSRYGHPRLHFDSSRPLDGIISYLTRECGGNVHSCGLVSISASSTVRNQCHQVVDYDWVDYWYSASEQNSWIQFDFKTRKISVTNYTIKTGGDSSVYLLQWALAGSNDEVNWTTLDERNTSDLKACGIAKSYACDSAESSAESFRFIRLTQTGPNSSGYAYHLQLRNLEFFGDIFNEL